MYGFASNNKDDTAAAAAAKALKDSAIVRDANRSIADAMTTVTNAVKKNMDALVKKGDSSIQVSALSDMYSKLQDTFSKTVEAAKKSAETLSDDNGSNKIKDNIKSAIETINNSISKSSEGLITKFQDSMPGNVVSSINDATSLTKDAFNKMSTDLKKVQSSSSNLSATSIYSELLALYNSENIVARLTFLLLILFAFILLLRIGTSIITWAFSHSTSPILLDGMINSKQMVQIPQNPAVNGAIPILRSVNDDFGIGFTWSVWINIDDFTYKEKEYKHIFHKGNDNINLSTAPVGMNFPNNSPGLYIAPDKNELVVIMNTFDSITEEVKIKDIPLNKWVCVVIRVNEQKQMDVYINGTLTRRHILPSIPKQNYGDVYVSMNGGFSGNTSSLRYYAYPIGTNEIQTIVNSGPNTKMISSGEQKNGDSMEYLATRWFFQPNA
jgi:hypothetical protein